MFSFHSSGQKGKPGLSTCRFYNNFTPVYLKVVSPPSSVLLIHTISVNTLTFHYRVHSSSLLSFTGPSGPGTNAPIVHSSLLPPLSSLSQSCRAHYVIIQPLQWPLLGFLPNGPCSRNCVWLLNLRFILLELCSGCITTESPNFYYQPGDFRIEFKLFLSIQGYPED